MIARRDALVLLCGSTAFAAAPAAAASLADWAGGARLMTRFVSAGIPVRSFAVPSTSMVPTLRHEDVVLADLRAAQKPPQRGDIIAVTVDASIYLKRAIGLPGDRIAFAGHRPTVNGRQADWQDAGEETVDSDLGRQRFLVRQEILPGGTPYRIAVEIKEDGQANPYADLAETVVPPERLFVVGDNRENSMDSRVPSMQPVLIGQVIGRIVARLRPKPDLLVPGDSIPGLPA